MWLIHAALRRPITVLIAIFALALSSVLALVRMPADILPNLDLPVIYVAQPYGGMSPAQMEGYLVYYYEYHFLYINGIERVESKSIQNVGLLKLTFHPGTDMSQALAQTISYVDRARAFMPYGTVPPFVMRFDAGSVPVGNLVFSSETRSVGEIQDLALNRVRPLFAALPGVSAPPPFGGNQRTIVVRVDPDRLRAYHLPPEEIVRAVTSGNVIVPAGNVRTGDLNRMVDNNAVVTHISDLLSLPIRTGAGPTVFLRDLGTVEDAADILTGYALFNGKRSVYIPVTKRASASTLAVVREVKRNLPAFQAVIPPDIQVTYELDQSGYVANALGSVLREAGLGALLTGLVVLLFLRQWRSSLIVATTIPLALLIAVVALWIARQTINIMTLGGLALAVGILVDEATVVIENIHTHLAGGATRATAVLDASREVIIPRLLAMLCVLAVFVPSFFMVGVSRSLFVPLALAVGFAMAASYFLASSLVPVLSVWLLRERQGDKSESHGRFERLRDWHGRRLTKLVRRPWLVVLASAAAISAIILLVGLHLETELFPPVKTGQFRLRFRAPTGTRVEETERQTIRLLESIHKSAGPGNVTTTLGYVGVQPASYPINSIYLWTSGPHEAVLQVALRRQSGLELGPFEERLRSSLPGEFPGATFSFEPGDLVSQIMSFGANTPIEVSASGPNFSDSRAYMGKVRAELARIPRLRDLQYGQPLDYPVIRVRVDRERAGQLGVAMDQVGKSLVTATSSSRFVVPNYWADPKSGIAYQLQVEIPQRLMGSIEDVNGVPLRPGPAAHPLLGDVAEVGYGMAVGEYDRNNGQRIVGVTANVEGAGLRRVAKEIDSAIGRAGEKPRGTRVAVRGLLEPMRETLASLGLGLALAVVAIFLLLAGWFQSARLALLVLANIPAVLAGVLVALLVTGTTLNIQSFMGAIMAVGVAVANGILYVNFAEQYRRDGEASEAAAVLGARTRMRPILMTSLAMVAGMVPMALALGEGAEQTAPLGRAVIGGLLASTIATLVILPSLFALVQRRASVASPSLDPSDAASRHHAADAPGGAS